MARLVTRKSRFMFSTALLVCGLCLIASIAVTHLRVPVAWAGTASLVLQAIVLAALVILAKYAENAPTSAELVAVARKLIEEEYQAIQAWSGVRTHWLTFGEMSKKTKVAYVGFLVFGFLLVIYALADAFGMMPEYRITRPNGEVETVARWMMVSFEAMFAILVLSFTQTMRFTTVDAWDDALKRFFKEMDIR